MFLTADEIEALTGRVHRSAQVKVLVAMGIEHKVRPDRSIAILRAHVEREMGLPAGSSIASREKEPNWSAL